ncbi:hypothetical protein NEMBOFW57_008786 [Staphylotrichum longicolle]|uniref:Uncharacterized protein n=1 Tax=Staphylotrichum longicolle TaxID=669026 RepID=A0AAD4ESN0_9PEZI|nr:hypothetical protein NEMBOFW57_008786 [Staphylotrichum longicolle]
MPRASPAKEADPPSTLTRRNLKNFTTEQRRETARRRGRSTPSASPDFHELDTVTSGDLPPPSQRLQPRIPKRTASQIAADDAAWEKWYDDNNLQTASQISPSRTPVVLKPSGPPPSSGVETREDRVRGPVNGRDDISASTEYSTSGHPKPKSPRRSSFPRMVAAVDAAGHVRWEPAVPPPPGPPTGRPTIPRQQPHAGPPSRQEPRFPPSFPAYHSTQNMNEIAAYLANASYVVALGGPPLVDLKYGIIVVPAGEESLLFSRAPDFALDQNFIDSIDDANRDYDRALRMHDPDKDSEEFVRHRFDDDFPSVSAGAQQNVEVALPKEEDLATEDIQEPHPKRHRRDTRRQSSGANPNGANPNAAATALKVAPSGGTGRNTRRAAQTADTSKPQGVAKTGSSSRAAKGVNSGSPAAKRTLRGKK